MLSIIGWNQSLTALNGSLLFVARFITPWTVVTTMNTTVQTSANQSQTNKKRGTDVVLVMNALCRLTP